MFPAVFHLLLVSNVGANVRELYKGCKQIEMETVHFIHEESIDKEF